MKGLYWTTVTELLRDVLSRAMKESTLNSFRLVGGTSLSLQIGHRRSIDIDLFSDAPYDSVDFKAIEHFFSVHYPYVATNGGQVGIGRSYFVGHNEQEAVKVDLYYTETFVRPVLETEGIRLAAVEEILAMKLDVISRGGRKKDFWDIHAFIEDYSLVAMIQFYEQRYRYSHASGGVIRRMTAFDEADNDFDPNCLRGEYWELIKYDLAQWAKATN